MVGISSLSQASHIRIIRRSVMFGKQVVMLGLGMEKEERESEVLRKKKETSSFISLIKRSSTNLEKDLQNL